MNAEVKILKEKLEFFKMMYEAADKLIEAYRAEHKRNPHEVVPSRWTCGCITCICEEPPYTDDSQCMGCGARACVDYPNCVCGQDGIEPDPEGLLGTAKQRKMVSDEILWLQVLDQHDALKEFAADLDRAPTHKYLSIVLRCHDMLDQAGIEGGSSTLIARLSTTLEYLDQLRSELGSEREMRERSFYHTNRKG